MDFVLFTGGFVGLRPSPLYSVTMCNQFEKPFTCYTLIKVSFFCYGGDSRAITAIRDLR